MAVSTYTTGVSLTGRSGDKIDCCSELSKQQPVSGSGAMIISSDGVTIISPLTALHPNSGLRSKISMKLPDWILLTNLSDAVQVVVGRDGEREGGF